MNDAAVNAAWEVSPRDVQAMREAGRDVVLLDCRIPAELEIARIDGAKHVPMADVPARLSELEEHADCKVVVFCHLGQRSLQVATFLRQQGFEDVCSLAGGIDRWSREVDPAVPQY